MTSTNKKKRRPQRHEPPVNQVPPYNGLCCGGPYDGQPMASLRLRKPMTLAVLGRIVGSGEYVLTWGVVWLWKKTP